MTSPISAIGALNGISDLPGITGMNTTSGLSADSDDTSSVQAPNQNFAGMLAKGLQSVQGTQTKADNLAIQAADGTLKDPAQYTMAATEASLALELTIALRNKALDAFQEIMRMQA